MKIYVMLITSIFAFFGLFSMEEPRPTLTAAFTHITNNRKSAIIVHTENEKVTINAGDRKNINLSIPLEVKLHQGRTLAKFKKPYPFITDIADEGTSIFRFDGAIHEFQGGIRGYHIHIDVFLFGPSGSDFKMVKNIKHETTNMENVDVGIQLTLNEDIRTSEMEIIVTTR
jgi:hypothetical protein